MRKITSYIFISFLTSLLVFGSYSNVLSENVDNVSYDEIKKVVEELVLIKDIEDEVVFGFPIEEVRLVGALENGRNIPYVVDFFEEYYEEKVLEQYLYYLKRSTSQRYHKEMGIFWGSNYKVIGNTAKREANSIEYEIDYKSIEFIGDVVVVNIEVTPTYFGDYNNRGVEFTEYVTEKREMELKLRKDGYGKYKLVELSEENLMAMEEEIQTEIDLKQNNEPLFSNPKMDSIEFDSEFQQEGYIFAYDLLKRFSIGGVVKVYDKYDKVFCMCGKLTQENAEDIINKEVPLDNLFEGFKGWDYGYLLNSDRDGVDGSVLLFDIKDGEVSRLSILPYYFEGEERQIDLAQQNLNNFSSALNQELNIYLGTEAKDGATTQQIENYIDKYMEGGFEGMLVEEQGGGEPWSLGSWILPELIDSSRRINTGRLGAWIYNPQTKEYSLSLPDGKQIIQPFTNAEAIRIYYESQHSYEDKFYWQQGVDIESHYFYESINLYQYDRDKITFDYLEDDNTKGRWRLTVDWRTYSLWGLYR